MDAAWTSKPVVLADWLVSRGGSAMYFCRVCAVSMTCSRLLFSVRFSGSRLGGFGRVLVGHAPSGDCLRAGLGAACLGRTGVLIAMLRETGADCRGSSARCAAQLIRERPDCGVVSWE